MKFCNSFKVKSVDPSEKRKAPAIPLAEFKEYLTDYYNMNVGIGDSEDYIVDAIEREEFIKKIFQSRTVADCKGFYSELQFITDDPTSKEVKSADASPSLLGVQVLPNKIPIYGFLLGGELEKPYFAMIYFNGRGLRVFVPESGNTVNSDFYTALGSEGRSANEDLGELVSEYERTLGKKLDDIKCSECPDEELEFWQPSIAYCLKNGYAVSEEEAYDVMNTVSWSYILEDIQAVIEESDERDASEEATFILASGEKEDDDEECYEPEEEEEDYEPEEDYESEEEEESSHTFTSSTPIRVSPEEDDDVDLIESIKITIPMTEEEEALNFKSLENPSVTEEDDFCNKRRSMIRFGKLSLPQMRQEKFQNKLNEYYDTTEHVTFDYTADPIILATNIMQITDISINVDFATIKASESKIISNSGNPLLGFKTLPNGIHFFGMEVGETIEGETQALFVALFCDGAKIIPYVPVYGNTFNADLRTVFGKENESIDKAKFVKMYEKISKETIPAENKSAMTEYYFKIKGYSIEKIDELKHTGSWNAILEDLCFAIQTQEIF